MLKLNVLGLCKNELTLLRWNGLSVCFAKPRVWFFSINVIGRIFRWVRYQNYMQFILPVHAKPTVYLLKPYVAFFLKSGKIFYIFADGTLYGSILRFLFSVKRPSIFNKRGFNILNRIYYKKRGKVTSYVTNK